MKILTQLKKKSPAAEAHLRANVIQILKQRGAITRKDLMGSTNPEMDLSVVPDDIPCGVVLNTILDNMEQERVLIITRHPPAYDPYHDTVALAHVPRRGEPTKLKLVLT